MCREGRFREDLFYRLKKLFLKTPTLKERKEDIEPLVRYFIAKNGRTDLTVSDEVLSFLMSYDWPGNIRELENIIEYMIAVSNKSVITIDQLPLDFFDENLSQPDLYEAKEMIVSNVQRDEYVFILEKIRDYNECGRAISRKRLSQLSKEYRYVLTENQIRTRTDALMEMGLLFKSKGRAGMQLSVKGVEFLQTRKVEIISNP
jgi:transcriptional regulator with PAS, ATPase and Fis domain